MITVAIVAGYLDRNSEADEGSVLYSPYAQPIYIGILCMYLVLPRVILKKMVVIMIICVYLLSLATVLNTATYDQIDSDSGVMAYVVFWGIQFLSVVAIIVFFVIACRECQGNVNEEIVQANSDARDLFNKIPCVIYQPFMKMKAKECAICLSNYEQDETIKIIPGCYHTFHSECIRVWFEANSTCPFCRRDITREQIEEFERIPEEEICKSIQAKDIRAPVGRALQPISPKE
ncbi:unnamed protein product [Moneuplotes crassus]|uniref:RING-type domain-containing protein n=1 Tax=Euplotes crassus TaxID=5936 RepID=A0AAD1YAE0_EUPCR|nr:unnamed protein product [Moneuplotes crassus]